MGTGLIITETTGTAGSGHGHWSGLTGTTGTAGSTGATGLTGFTGSTGLTRATLQLSMSPNASALATVMHVVEFEELRLVEELDVVGAGPAPGIMCLGLRLGSTSAGGSHGTSTQLTINGVTVLCFVVCCAY